MKLSPHEISKIVDQIQHMRAAERNGLYKTDRSIFDYYESLDGLNASLEYMSGLASNRVVDIGAGVTKAVHQLSQANSDLDFYATVMYRSPKIADYHGFQKTMITSAEKMRIGKHAPYAGMLGVWSLSYTRSPHVVVANMKKHLVPGGLVKTTLSKATTPVHALRIIQYLSVFESEGFSLAYRNRGSASAVVIALNDGGGNKALAENLLDKDLDQYLEREKLDNSSADNR